MTEKNVTKHEHVITTEQWKHALTAGPRPPLSRRRKLALAVKDLRWRLARWLDPYY